MLSTLAVGLAAGTGLWVLALFATAFMLAVLWIVESFEPAARQTFMLKVGADDAAAIKNALEAVLRSAHLRYELREFSETELQYRVTMAARESTGRVSALIEKTDLAKLTSVDWENKKQ